jgi:hypothetical protein
MKETTSDADLCLDGKMILKWTLKKEDIIFDVLAASRLKIFLALPPKL